MKEIGGPFFTTKAGRIGLGLAGAKRILILWADWLLTARRPGTTVICPVQIQRKIAWARPGGR